MKIILSPAKRMRQSVDIPAPSGLPVFLSQAERLLAWMRSRSGSELKALWRCNDEIAEQNIKRLETMDLRNPGQLSAALVAYDGIQYQYMAPQIFTEEYYRYVQEHVRILSGFYGILKPLDGVTPYRLEMQARVRTDFCRNLYDYWGDSLYRELTRDDPVILNLASGEYSRCIAKYVKPSDHYVTCRFGQLENGKLKEKGVYVKMARGEMVRFLAEQDAQTPEQARKFTRLGFTYREEDSTKDQYVFIKE